MAQAPIEVRIGGKTVGDAVKANNLKALTKLAAALSVTARLAKHVRDRAMSGDFATQARPYSTRQSSQRRGFAANYFISESYATAVGESRRGWLSSAAFHEAINRKPGNITGGMWSGLRVRNFGTAGAIIEFAGRSLGSRIKARKNGKANQRVMVANREKGKQVYKRLRINVIQPTDPEIESVGAALMRVAAKLIAFGAAVKYTGGTENRTLARQIAADVEGGRTTRLM
jgi:hypothetical protein